MKTNQERANQVRRAERSADRRGFYGDDFRAEVDAIIAHDDRWDEIADEALAERRAARRAARR